MNMKNILSLFLAFLLLNFYSCKENSYPQSLLLADSLAFVDPDSAVSLLKSIKKDISFQPKDIQMYYHLLCVKADDKAYLEITSDSMIFKVLRYYIDVKDDRHLPEAYFYAGRVCKELGDAPRALGYFNKALDALENSPLYKLRSLIYSQIGLLYSQQCIYDEAIAMFYQAYRYSRLQGDSVSMIYDLRDIASVYKNTNMADSALLYYQHAYELADTLQSRRMMDMIQGQMASLYKRIGKYDLAKIALQRTLSTMDKDNRSGVYSIASDLYYKIGNKDSALYYYNELLDCGTIYAKADARWHLAEFALQEGKAQKATEHLEQYMECIDSVWALTDAETVRKMQSLYNYTLREKENNRLKVENSRKQFYLTCSVISLAFIFSCFLAYFQYSRKKQAQLNLQLLKLRQLEKEQYQESARFIEENKKKQEELENMLKNNTYFSLQKEQAEQQKKYLYYAGKQAEFELLEREQKKKALIGSDTCHYFREVCRGEGNVYVPSEMWKALEEAVNDACKGFTEKLFQIRKLSELEFHICLLIKTGSSPKDMAKLTNHSKEAVASVRRRLYEKFFGKKGTPQQWDEFIDLL